MGRQLKESPQTGGRGFRDTFPPLDKVSTTGVWMVLVGETQPRPSETPLRGTTFLLVKTIQQPIRIFEISGYLSCHGEQNGGYCVKEHRKLYQKQVSKVTLHFVWGHISKKQTVLWNQPSSNGCRLEGFQANRLKLLPELLLPILMRVVSYSGIPKNFGLS